MIAKQCFNCQNEGQPLICRECIHNCLPDIKNDRFKARIVEIRPEKAGELWKDEEGTFFHTEQCEDESLVFVCKKYGMTLLNIVHNKNGWKRVFPKVEDESVERIEIEGVSFWGCTNSAGVHIMAESTEDLCELIRKPSNKKMKMILEIPKDKP